MVGKSTTRKIKLSDGCCGRLERIIGNPKKRVWRARIVLELGSGRGLAETVRRHQRHRQRLEQRHPGGFCRPMHQRYFGGVQMPIWFGRHSGNGESQPPTAAIAAAGGGLDFGPQQFKPGTSA